MLKLGILGAGSFVQRRILPALKEIPTLHLVVLQKRSLTEAQQLATTAGCQAISAREDLLAFPELDLVFIATPPAVHEEDALFCSRHSLPTLCEKPLAPTASSVKRMLSSFSQTNTPFFVGHSLRFKPAVQQATRLLKEGKIGTLLHCEITLSIPVSQDNWRWNAECGVLQDLGIHAIDLIHFLTDREIETISSHSVSLSRAEGAFGLSHGITAHFTCAFDKPYHTGFSLTGTKGTLLSENSLRQHEKPLDTLVFLSEHTQEPLLLPEANIYVEELTHVAAVLLGKEPSLITAETALNNHLILDKLYANKSHSGKK